MVAIGFRPILWHVMKYFANFGSDHLASLSGIPPKVGLRLSVAAVAASVHGRRQHQRQRRLEGVSRRPWRWHRLVKLGALAAMGANSVQPLTDQQLDPVRCRRRHLLNRIPQSQQFGHVNIIAIDRSLLNTLSNATPAQSFQPAIKLRRDVVSVAFPLVEVSRKLLLSPISKSPNQSAGKLGTRNNCIASGPSEL
jgi:hypothetical protein